MTACMMSWLFRGLFFPHGYLVPVISLLLSFAERTDLWQAPEMDPIVSRHHHHLEVTESFYSYLSFTSIGVILSCLVFKVIYQVSTCLSEKQ